MNMNFVYPTDWNTTDDFPEDDTNLRAQEVWDTVIFCMSFAICIFGVVDNGMVVWYLGFRIQKNPFTTYILNLAFADFIFLLIFSSILLCFILGMHLSLYREKIFELIRAVFMFGYVTSQYLLTSISVERCASVVFPIWYRCHRPRHQSAIVCTLIWILSGLPLIAYLINCGGYDRCNWIFIFQDFVSFLVFVPLMLLSNVTIICKIYKSSRRRHPPRLYILIIITVCSFLFLCVPLSMYVFLEYFNIYLVKYTYAGILSPIINSSFNPVIYFLVGSLSRRRSRCSIIVALRRAFLDHYDPPH